MMRHKHIRLDQEKIDIVKKIFSVETDTEAIDKALTKIIHESEETVRRRKIAGEMARLRTTVGEVKEDPAEWVRLAREERNSGHDSHR
jgi:uncharacterized protein with PhoU and TrkA domain